MKNKVVTVPKSIVSEGTYRQRNKKGQFVYVDITKDMLNELVDTFNEMRASGLRVPAPFKHDFSKIPVKVTEGDEGFLENSLENAGFWEKLEVKVNDEGRAELFGELETTEDFEKLIGTTIRDTSIYMNPEWVDGEGTKWKNALMHVALVTHPIQKGQKNFHEVPEAGFSIAMSDMVPDVGDTGTITELSTMFKKVGVYLSPDTNLGNLVRNLRIALGQKLLQEEGNSTSEQLKLSSDIIPVGSIIMANFNQKQVEALIGAKVINPETGAPFTAEDFKSSAPKVDPAQEVIMSNMKNTLQSDRKRVYAEKIGMFVAQRKVDADFAKNQIQPMIDNYQLQFDAAGNVVPQNLDMLVMSFEAMPTPVPQTTPGTDQRFMIAGIDTAEGTKRSQEDYDKLAEMMAKQIA